MATHKVQVSMNGLRKGLVDDAQELRQAIKDVFDFLDEDDKQELTERFDTLACGLNSLNCIHAENDENFTCMEDVEVELIGQYE